MNPLGTSIGRKWLKFVPATAVAYVLIGTTPQIARACSVDRVRTPQEIVMLADAIYRVRAPVLVGSAPTPRTEPSVIRFVVMETLKGAPLDRLPVSGVLGSADDPNDYPVPYAFVRPAGRRGTCFAQEYGATRDFLLFMRAGTPYWSPLAPTNEQVFGPSDPWVEWVRTALRPES
jgi:hypothetical protein